MLQFPALAHQCGVAERVKSYDRLLHHRLSNIFHDHCLTSCQIKQLVRASNNNNSTIIKQQILEQEPVLSRYFSKETLKRFSLLWITVLGSYHDSAELLVTSGAADVNELYGLQPVAYDLVHLLDEKSSILHALLQMDASVENERLIRLVTDHNADLQARDSMRHTVLHLSARRGRVQMTKFLLEKGADVNAVDFYGGTPLLLAVSGTKAGELLPLLMRHGADVYVKDRDGENVLHRLSICPDVEYTDLARVLLLEMGFSLEDRETCYQRQPIHLAVIAGNNELVSKRTFSNFAPQYSIYQTKKQLGNYVIVNYRSFVSFKYLL